MRSGFIKQNRREINATVYIQYTR